MLNPDNLRPRLTYEHYRTGKAEPTPLVVEDPRWLRVLIRAANWAALVAFILLAVGIYAYATRPPASTDQQGSPSSDRGAVGGKRSV